MITLILFSFSILTLSTSSWIMFWVMSELTTYLFVSKMTYEKYKKNKTDTPAIYMIMSFLSSALMLMLFAINSDFMGTIFLMNLNSESMINQIQSILITIALCIKMGMMPFHSWLYIVMEKMSWNSILILSTIQKIIPIWGIMMLGNMKTIFLSILISSIMIMFLPLKSKNMYFFLATSAIMNSMWIMLSCLSSIITTVVYSIIYFLLTFNLLEIIKKFNLKTFNKFVEKSSMISIFSLIGIPPLLGFFSKMYIITSTNMMNIMISNNLMLILMLMIISTTIVSFMYLKSFMPMLIEIKNSNLMMKNKTMKLNEIMMINFMSPAIFIIIEILF